MDPLNVLAKFEFHSFTSSRDNSDWSFGWGANPNLREGEAVGVGDGTIRKSSDEFLAPHSNFSSIFTRFRDIAAFVLKNDIFSHTTSSLPQISPCSPGSRWVWSPGRKRFLEWTHTIAINCLERRPLADSAVGSLYMQHARPRL